MRIDVVPTSMTADGLAFLPRGGLDMESVESISNRIVCRVRLVDHKNPFYGDRTSEGLGRQITRRQAYLIGFPVSAALMKFSLM